MSKLIVIIAMLGLASLVWAGGAAETTGTISPADAQTLLKNDQSVILMDVRTADEFTAGHIAGAKLLPYDQITAATAAADIPAKDRTVVVYCRSGHRAGIAVKTLRELGYTKVLNLGGIVDWPYATVEGSAK